MTGSKESDWIVYRFSDDLPPQYRDRQLDGLWVDRSGVPEAASLIEQRGDGDPEPGECVAVSTGRFEHRIVNTKPVTLIGYWACGVASLSSDPGFETQVAEVYEIRPLWRIDITGHRDDNGG